MSNRYVISKTVLILHDEVAENVTLAKLCQMFGRES